MVWRRVPGAYSFGSTQMLTTADLADRPHRLARALKGRADLARLVHLLAVPAQHLRELRERDVAQQVPDPAPLLAVLGDLAVADLVHRRVVADDRDVGGAEAVCGLHVEGGHAERAVAVVAEDLLVGVGEPGREREPGSDPERPERPRVHPVAGGTRLHGLGTDGDDVAAVPDVDGVLGQELVQLPRDAIGVDRRLVGAEEGHQLLGLLDLEGPELLEPRLATVAARPAARGRGVRHRAENRARVAHQPQGHVAVLADRAVVEVDLDHRRVVPEPLAVAHAEVEGGADDHDDVRLLEGVAARAVEVVRVPRGEEAAPGPVEVRRNVELADEAQRLLVPARGPHLGPEEDRRPLALDEEVGEALDVRRVADRLRRRPVVPGLRNDRGVGRHLAVEHVARDLEVARPGGAREALARRHRHHVRDALGRRHRCGELGDGGRDVDVGEVLERAHLVLAEGALPADVEHRALGAERGRDPGHRVGEAGPGRRHHAAEAPGLAGVAVRRVSRDLLVADVDDADPLVDAPVVDVDDVTAAEGEDGVHPLAPEGTGDQVPARYDFAAPVLGDEGVGGGVFRGGGGRGGCGHVGSPWFRFR